MSLGVLAGPGQLVLGDLADREAAAASPSAVLLGGVAVDLGPPVGVLGLGGVTQLGELALVLGAALVEFAGDGLAQLGGLTVHRGVDVLGLRPQRLGQGLGRLPDVRGLGARLG